MNEQTDWDWKLEHGMCPPIPYDAEKRAKEEAEEEVERKKKNVLRNKKIGQTLKNKRLIDNTIETLQRTRQKLITAETDISCLLANFKNLEKEGRKNE